MINPSVNHKTIGNIIIPNNEKFIYISPIIVVTKEDPPKELAVITVILSGFPSQIDLGT